MICPSRDLLLDKVAKICKTYDNHDEDQDIDHDEDQDIDRDKDHAFDHNGDQDIDRDNDQECDYKQQNRDM